MLSLHVCARFYATFWILWHLRVESLLKLCKHRLILLTRHERNRETFGTETTGTTNTMKVRVGVSWQVVVDGQVDSLDVDTTSEDISSNADSLVEVFEFLVSFDSAMMISLKTSQSRRILTVLLVILLSVQQSTGSCIHVAAYRAQ